MSSRPGLTKQDSVGRVLLSRCVRLLQQFSPRPSSLPLHLNPVEMQFFKSQLKEEHTFVAKQHSVGRKAGSYQARSSQAGQDPVGGVLQSIFLVVK